MCVSHVRYLLCFVFYYSEEVGVHYENCRCFVSEFLFEAVKADATCRCVVIHVGYFNVGFKVGLYRAQCVGVDVARDENFFAFHYSCRHAECCAYSLTSVVVGNVAYIIVEKFGHHRLVFKHCVKAAVVFIWLTCVSCQKFGTVDYFVYNCRYITVVAAGSKEAAKLFRRTVLIQNSAYMTVKTGFVRVRFGKLHRLLHADFFGNVSYEFFNCFHSDVLQHLFLH